VSLAPRLLPDSRRAGVTLLLVVLVGLALRLYGFRGFGATDDAAYAQIAHQIAQGTYRIGSYTGPAVFPLRIGIIYPTALAFRWLGVSEWSMVSLPFVVSLLSILLAYATATYFFGRRAGLLAAALWALLPIDVFQASLLVPDLPAAFFASLGVLGVIVLANSRLPAGTTLFLGGTAAGLSFGASWLCKETVAYAAPLCAVLLATHWKKGWQRQVTMWAGVAVGSLAVLAGEMLVYHGATGDWLFHVHETERNYHQYQNAFFVGGSALTEAGGGSYARAVVRRLLVDGPETILLNARFLYVPLLAAIVSLHALYRRDKTFLIPGLWAGTLAFMFNFSSSSMRSYVPLVLFDRYLYPLFLPCIALIAGFLAWLLWPATDDRRVHREGRFWGTLLIGWLLLIAAYGNYAYRRFLPGWAAEVRTLSKVLKPTDRVYADILSIHGLQFFWSYPGNMNVVNFEDMSPTTPIHAGDYVLLNQRYLGWLTGKAGWWPTEHADYAPPAFVHDVPSTWEKVWGNGNATLYRAR
jgi:4-amino-4-deoxy-L-arabinose transferase-like glycosyltransferase